jgi:hypothetical protein
MESKSAISRLLTTPVAVVNLGVEDFAESLEDQGARVVHVTWSPPAVDDPEIVAILEKLL